MGRTEKRPTARRRKGLRWLRRAGALASLLSMAVYLLLVIASYARAAAVLACSLVLVAGAWEWFRGRARLGRTVYRPLSAEIQKELGLARLQMLTASVLAAAAFLCAPPVAVALGFAATFFLLLLSAAVSGPLSEEEERRNLLKPTAARECELIERWARIASRVRKVPGFRWIPEAAHREGPREHVSVLRTVSMLILYSGCAFYLLTGVALGISGVAPLPRLKLPSKIGVLPFNLIFPDGDKDPEPRLTYAELCPEIPNPLSIGHQLGPLFRRDGAVKAGCGTEAVRIGETGTWVSPGMCENELRSLTVSAPGYNPAIVYGSPARFAWAAAQAGKLVALEVAEPNEGDVYLVVTRDGTYGFARPTRSVQEDPKHPRSCTEVGGRARSFAKLEPAMVNLWLELMRSRAEWSWPKPGKEQPGSLFFTDQFDAALVAEGDCEEPESCWLEVEREVWPQQGSGFVSLEELAPYMPAPTGG